jgi:hypothetical protein
VSRSNPNEGGIPNPAVRWFEWNGEAGTVRYYDKDAKKTVDVGSDFKFLLLDQLGGVRGWHDASNSGIYSNEVKDTRQEALIVKAFKGGTLAEGVYRDIKDRVSTLGGQFVANLYIAFKHEGALAIGVLRFKGAALGSWMEFTKKHRAELYSIAIRIHGFTEGKKGRIVYRMPILEVAAISPEANAAALALDKKLQEFFAAYFKRTKREQVETPHQPTDDLVGDEDTDDSDDSDDGGGSYYAGNEYAPLTDDDIPF